jgi:hypothetical protein
MVTTADRIIAAMGVNRHENARITIGQLLCACHFCQCSPDALTVQYESTASYGEAPAVRRTAFIPAAQTE